jgi:hypothetical protein
MKTTAYHGTLNEFEEFDVRFSCDGGHHFGSVKQAKARLRRIDDGVSDWHVMKCEIEMNKPIEGLIDIDDWKDHQALAWSILQTQDDEELRAIARKYRHEPYKFLGDTPPKQMYREIKALGYDGLTYSNEGEGSGESWMIFSDEQVRIIREL